MIREAMSSRSVPMPQMSVEPRYNDPTCYCDGCDHEATDYIFEWDGEYLCEDCFKKAFMQFLDDDCTSTDMADMVNAVLGKHTVKWMTDDEYREIMED